MTQTSEETPEIAIEPTENEQKATEVEVGVTDTASAHTDTAKIKQKKNNYWQYFVKTLTNPATRVENFPKHYAFINIGLYALATMMLVLPSVMWGTGFTSEEDRGKLMAFAISLMLQIGVGIFIALLVSSGIVFLIQRFMYRRAVTYTDAVVRYASYLTLGSVVMLIGNLVFILVINYYLTIIYYQLAAVAIQKIVILFVVPIAIATD